MTRLLGCVLLAGALASCGKPAPADRQIAVEPAATPAPAEAPAAPPLAAATGFDWTGNWAARAELCRGGVWRFASDGAETDGESSCEMRKVVVETDDRAAFDMACTTEGMASSERWTLTRRSDGRMDVTRSLDGKLFADVTLQRCG